MIVSAPQSDEIGLLNVPRVLLQRAETRADSGLREGQSRHERDEAGAEEEAQGGVAELPAAGSRGS